MRSRKLIIVLLAAILVLLVFSAYGISSPHHRFTTTVVKNRQFTINTYSLNSGVSIANLTTTHINEKNQAFTPTSGKLYFNISETGLPAGTTWTVNVNGSIYQVSGNILSRTVSSGNIVNYTLFDTSNYYTNISKGSVKIQNSSVTVKVEYTHFSYIKGTINPKNGSLSINGVYQKVTNGNFSLTVENGTFDVVAIDTGFNTYYDNFTLSPGHTENIIINLTKATPSPPPYSPPPSTPEKSILIYAVAGAAAAIVILTAYAIIYRRGRQ